jgi:hypothetical protein
LHGPNGNKYRQRAAELGAQIQRESQGCTEAYCNIILDEHRLKKASNDLQSPMHNVDSNQK